MAFEPEQRRLGRREGTGARVKSLLVKAFALAAAGLVLVSAIAISLVFFALAVVALAAFGVYLYWRTRHVRKQMRSTFEGGAVIDGVVIREADGQQIDQH